MNKLTTFLGAGFVAAIGLAGSVSAAVVVESEIGLGGVTGVSIALSSTATSLNSNCPDGPSKPCADVNAKTLTIVADAGYVFDLTSIRYKFAGNGDTLTATYAPPTGGMETITKLPGDPSSGQTWLLNLTGLTTISFTGTTGSGGTNSNISVDSFDITARTSAVPLPAGGLLLLGGLGGLTAVRRRKRTA